MCSAERCKKGEYHMKTWFEWMDCYYEPAVQEVADAEETERLKAQVMERIGVGTADSHIRPRRGLKKAAIAIAAAAFACCVGVGAMAAVGFPWDSVFGGYFGDNAQEQALELGMPGNGLELSAKDGGCTLTLKGALFDGDQLYLPLTLSFDQEKPNPDWSYYVMGLVEGRGDAGSVMLSDENQDDQSVNLMCKLDGSGLKSGQTITWNVIYLYANSADEVGNTTCEWEKEGEWSFTFAVPQAQPTQVWDIPDGVSDPVTGIPLRQVRLTPMRVSLVFEGLPDDSDMRNTLSEAQIVLHFADGSMRDLGKGGNRDAQGTIDAQTSPIGQAYYEVSCEYDEFLDPSQITAVEINGYSVQCP